MHDFFLAKEIVDQLIRIAEEKKLSKIMKVNLEIGNISMSHDGHPEHLEEINISNLEFGLKGIAKNVDILKEAEFSIKKVEGDGWKIADIDAE